MGFNIFLKEYDFKLITRSPFNAKATGKIEFCVKKAKKMLKKVRSPHRAIRPPEHTPPGYDLLSSAEVSLSKNKVHFADVCNVVGSIRATSSRRTR